MFRVQQSAKAVMLSGYLILSGFANHTPVELRWATIFVGAGLG